MSTIKDVAKKVGVSVSTVSYALSGTRPISDATRQRIMDAIHELNYHPNLLARGLINKRTRIIALLYPTLSLSSLEDLPTEFIASVTNVTYERDYGLLLFTHELGETEIQRLMNQGLVDGLVLMEVLRHDPRVDLMKNSGYPFSLIGHSESNDGISFVDMDFYTAYRMAVEHLAGLNHQEIGFLPTILDIERPQRNYLFESIRGFRETVQKLGIRGIVHGCDPTIQGGYEAMKDLLENQSCLSAVITGNELIYNGVSQALQEKCLSVPGDFSVIGVISHRSAEKYSPKITNISLPAIEMGRMGTEFLINQLEDPNFKTQQVLLPPELIIRQSTGPFKERSSC
jgi:DNA-binding LacI/PurR family transcriptional regulator